MFFVGLLTAFAISFVLAVVYIKKISVRWYEWLLAFIGVLIIILTIQNFMAAFDENEATAAWLFWLYMGLPGIIILAIPVVLMWRRNFVKS